MTSFLLQAQGLNGFTIESGLPPFPMQAAFFKVS